jgi:hypothetical protein
MYFVCQGLNNTIYGSKKRCYSYLPFRSQLRADNEFSLNLWKAVTIEGYKKRGRSWHNLKFSYRTVNPMHVLHKPAGTPLSFIQVVKTI